MKSARIGALATMVAILVGGSMYPATAAPILDPDGDGIVTEGEVLAAPLLPTTLAPGRDGNRDGAISLGEAAGIAASRTWTGKFSMDLTNGRYEPYGRLSLDAPRSKWTFFLTKLGSADEYQIEVDPTMDPKALGYAAYDFTFEEASGAIYKTASPWVRNTFQKKVKFTSAGAPTIVRVTIDAT